MGVHPSFQHQGVARRLVQAVVSSLRSLSSGLDSEGTLTYAHVQQCNLPARRFYAEMGMQDYSRAIRNVYLMSGLNEREREGVLVMGRVS